MFDFPQIPESLETLSANELRSLAVEIRQAIRRVVEDLSGAAEALGVSEADVLTRAEEFKATERKITVEARKRELSAATAEEDDEPPVEASDDPDDGDDEDEDEDDGGDDDEVEAVAEEPVAVGAHTAGTPARRVRTTTGSGARPSTSPDRVQHGQFCKVGGRVDSGDAFDSWGEFSDALIQRARLIDPGSKEKFHVGRAYGHFDERHRLTEDIMFNLQLFERQEDEELTAAMCAPAIPVYDLACANTARRPVFGSLSAFQPAARGAVTIYPSPTLEDITTGFGVWTNTEDSDPEATKDPCQTIECATPVEYRLYALYRCLTVKNLLQLTYPELVEAYLNRLAARWARLGEVTLLNAMGTEADDTAVTGTGWGGTTSLIHGLLQYLVAYQNLQRWDAPSFEFWAHRELLLAIKADIVSRRRHDGGVTRIPSDATINGMFQDAGFTPHWTLDYANWMTAPQPFQGVGGQLRQFSRNAELLVAPTGKFAVMDRGELNVGVTGNNIYRDNTSNSRNEFTFFFESFEGLVNTDSCPAHILDFADLCWNGRQVHDVYVGCTGEADADASGAL